MSTWVRRKKLQPQSLLRWFYRRSDLSLRTYFEFEGQKIVNIYLCLCYLKEDDIFFLFVLFSIKKKKKDKVMINNIAFYLRCFKFGFQINVLCSLASFSDSWIDTYVVTGYTYLCICIMSSDRWGDRCFLQPVSHYACSCYWQGYFK